MIINKTNDRLKPNLKFPFPITTVTTRKVKENRKVNLPLSNISTTGPICVNANPEPTSYGTCCLSKQRCDGKRPLYNAVGRRDVHLVCGWELFARVTPSTTPEQSGLLSASAASPGASCLPKGTPPHDGAVYLPSPQRFSLATSLLLRAQEVAMKLCSANPAFPGLLQSSLRQARSPLLHCPVTHQGPWSTSAQPFRADHYQSFHYQLCQLFVTGWYNSLIQVSVYSCLSWESTTVRTWTPAEVTPYTRPGPE